MKSVFFHLLMGGQQAAEGGAAQGGMGGIISFLPIVAIIAIFYFLIIRPQNKRQKETQKMLAALKKGDRIVTIGGIHGTIQSVKESTVIVRVDDNTRLEFSRSAISNVEAASKEDKTAQIESREESDGEDSGAEDKKN
jgi:preprotein translocase subunit YajC